MSCGGKNEEKFVCFIKLAISIQIDSLVQIFDTKSPKNMFLYFHKN